MIKGIETKVETQDFKYAVHSEDTLYCSCGEIRKLPAVKNGESFSYPICSSCGTTAKDSVENLQYRKKIELQPKVTYAGVEKGVIKINRYDYDVTWDKKKDTVVVYRQPVMTLLIDCPNQKVSVVKNGREIQNERFTRKLSYENLISVVTDTNVETYIRIAYNKMGMWTSHFEKSKQVMRGLERIVKKPAYEVLANAGFSYERLSKLYDTYKINDGNETKLKPHAVLGIPKYAVSFLKSAHVITGNEIDSIRSVDKMIGSNNCKMLLEFLQEQTTESLNSFSFYFNQLYTRFNYKDVRRLMTYLIRDVRHQQGIVTIHEAASLLFDYNKICGELEVSPKRYPTSLKKVHDIANMNLMVIGDKVKEDKFKRVSESEEWENLLFSDRYYTVVCPRTPADLVDEGNSLSHCVKSYVTDVINGSCFIFFVRHKEHPEESLVTVEIRKSKSAGLSLVQARGIYNRKTTLEERAFLNAWAEEKDIRMSLHY